MLGGKWSMSVEIFHQRYHFRVRASPDTLDARDDVRCLPTGLILPSLRLPLLTVDLLRKTGITGGHQVIYHIADSARFAQTHERVHRGGPMFFFRMRRHSWRLVAEDVEHLAVAMALIGNGCRLKLVGFPSASNRVITSVSEVLPLLLRPTMTVVCFSRSRAASYNSRKFLTSIFFKCIEDPRFRDGTAFVPTPQTLR